ncbi:MAG: hypothetical protein HQK52_09390 [Oligoflexia bacterium]|nr:hypothetical protein [Oligoflexia bacterium]
MINYYRLLVVAFLITGCSSLPEKTPQDNYKEILRYVHQNDIVKAEEYFQNNKKSASGVDGKRYTYVEMDGSTWRHRKQQESTWDDIQKIISEDNSFLLKIINLCGSTIEENKIDPCLDFFAKVTCSQESRKDNCFISKNKIPNTYGYQLKIENLNAIFDGLWASQTRIDDAMPNFLVESHLISSIESRPISFMECHTISSIEGH